MKRALFVALLLALPSIAQAQNWYANYNKGVEAVRAGKHQSGADLLQRAINEMPNESGNTRYRNEAFITYVPHFWLGIAKYNLSDYDGALREFKTSQDQGVIQNTQYLPLLLDWQSKTNSAKQRTAENAAAESKGQASAAMRDAMIAQSGAVGAGGNRSESYQNAMKKLQEALDTQRKAGTDIGSYRKAAELAGQARELFNVAAEDGRRARAARPAAVAAKPAPVQPQPVTPIQQPQPQPAVVAQQQAPPSAATKPPSMTRPAATQVAQQQPQQKEPEPETEALVNARIAVQTYKRKLMDAHLPLGDAQKLEKSLTPKSDAKAIARVVAQVEEKERALAAKLAKVAKPPEAVAADNNRDADLRAQLESAFRLFASGDLDSSEKRLSTLVGGPRGAEAYLLRGCTRYTAAMLSRTRDEVKLAAATSDFRAALQLNAALRLDRAAFSPKLVAYFDSVRTQTFAR